MSHATAPLSEVCSFRHGGTPSKGNASYWGGTIPWISPKDMKASVLTASQDTITEAGVSGSAASVVPEGSILVVARSGILAHTLPVALAGRPLAFNQDIKAIQVTSEKVLGEYVYWFIRGREHEVLTRGVKKGATVHSLQSGYLEGLDIPLVPLPEQRRIVDLLSRAENIVQMRREAEQKAKELIPALFLDMFGDPVTNPKDGEVVELRGHDEDRLEAQSVVRLGDVAEVVSGVAKGRKLVGKVTRETPYLRVANVQAGGLDLAEMKYIPATADEIEELAVRVGDVLLTEGGDFDKVGRGALLEADIGECIHQNHVFRVRTHADRVMPEYFAAYLQTSAARQYFLKAAKKTSNLASINMTQLRNLPLPMPPLEIQRDFQKNFRACRALGMQQSEATGIADVSFQSLLARVFSEGQAT